MTTRMRFQQLAILLLLQPLSLLCFQVQSLHQPVVQPRQLQVVSTSALFALRREFLLSSLAYSATLTTSPVFVVADKVASTAAATGASIIPTPPFSTDLSWPLGKVAFSLLPLAGTSTRRATVQEVLVPDTIWTFDQLQGIVNVNVPVRQTVIRLSPAAGGGLWVHNPVAPTPQLLSMMKNLERQYGPIRHIVLGTVALEHKATFGAFAQNFPNATVWIQPGQWSFPFNLPIELEGVTQRGPKLREIPVPGRPVSSSVYEFYSRKDPIPEWAADFDWEVLGPFAFQSVGGFSETAFFHKPTRSLIVTDTVVSVTETPPAIIMEDPRALLYHARDRSDIVLPDTEENRKKGWRRMVQFGLVFFPSQIDVVSVGRAFRDASQVDPRMRNLGEGSIPISPSLYPWTWHANDADVANFRAISQDGAPFCPPILTKLILDREPQATIKWVDAVCRRFDFVRVIPGHLNNNLQVGPKEFGAAFDVLRSTPQRAYPQRPLPDDLALLQKASDLLTNLGVVGPSQVCDGEPARVLGRFRR
ncbi:DUF4336-containing protein [Fragilaria crotonensis]|nr:DUF4336-containing protein [Fragilaria crotonensis]